MSAQSKKVAAGVAAVLGLSAAACFGGDEPLFDVTRQDGNSAEGYFVIDPEPTTLAVGAKIDWRVRDYEGPDTADKAAKVRDVKVSDPALLGMEGVSGDLITVSGKAAGSGSVTFQGDADGDALRDSFKVPTLVPTAMRLETCAPDGVHVRGMPTYLPFSFSDAAESLAYGYGYYPVALTPPAGGLVNLDNRDPFAMRVDIASDAGDTLEVASTLAGDTNKVSLPLIDLSQVTRVEAAPITDLPPGASGRLELRAWAGDLPVCTPFEAKITVQTPDTCQVAAGNGASQKETTVFMHGVTVRTSGSSGRCSIKIVLLAALAAGVVRELVVDFPVQAPASSGGGGSDFD